MNNNNESWKHKFFFAQLAHPAFISSLIDNQLQITFVNRRLIELVPEESNRKTVESLFNFLFQNKIIIQNYYSCVENIIKNVNYSAQEKKTIGYLTLSLSKENIEKRNLIYSENIEGLRSNITENNKPLYFDIFSIPQYQHSELTGFQAILPIVNRRRNEYFKFLFESKRNQKLDNAVYGLSHVIGSHQIPDAKNFLGLIADKLMNIDTKTHFHDRAGLKNYYTEQFNNYQLFLSDVMLATHKINQPFSDTIFTGYNASRIKHILLSTFSVISSNQLEALNIIGRGIMDGAAEGAVSFFQNGFDNEEVELPSSTGETYLTIFVMNYLRNLYKHSTSSTYSINFKNNIEYVKDFPGFGNITKRNAYNALFEITEVEDVHLKNDYYQLNIYDESKCNYYNSIKPNIKKLIKKIREDESLIDKVDKDDFKPLKKYCDSLTKQDIRLSNCIELLKQIKEVYPFEYNIEGIDNDEIKDLLKELNPHITNFKSDEELQKLADDLNSYIDDEKEGAYKGLKEMKTLASALIAMPLEEFEVKDLRDKKTSYITKDGRVFPKKIMTYSVDKKRHVIKLSIYLKKKKFASVWVDNKAEFPPECVIALKARGVDLKGKEDDKNLQASYDFVVDINSFSFNRKKTSKYRNFRFIYFENDDIIREVKSNTENIDNSVEHFIDKIKSSWVNNLPEISIHYAGADNLVNKTLENRSKVQDPEKPQINALLSSHFNYFKGEEAEKKWEDWDYIECISSKSGGINIEKAKDRYKQIETICTEVVIFDEVLQNIHHNDVSTDKDPDLDSKTFIETLAKKGIVIPQKPDLKEYFYGESGGNVSDFENIVNGKINDDKLPRYIIIHYSGFEKLIKREYGSCNLEELKAYFTENNLKLNTNNLNKSELEEKLMLNEFKKFAEKYKDKPTYVVYISGKNPANLKNNNILFVNRNTIENIITKQNSKYHLVSLLNSLRFKQL